MKICRLYWLIWWVLMNRNKTYGIPNYKSEKIILKWIKIKANECTLHFYSWNHALNIFMQIPRNKSHRDYSERGLERKKKKLFRVTFKRSDMVDGFQGPTIPTAWQIHGPDGWGAIEIATCIARHLSEVACWWLSSINEHRFHDGTLSTVNGHRYHDGTYICPSNN